MSSRWTGFFVWALVAASTALWGFKIFAATRPVPENASVPQVSIAQNGPMPRLFGVTPAPTVDEQPPSAASDRYQLFGEVAPRNGAGGYAIVGIDNNPPLPWKIGAELEDNVHLLAVNKRSAEFGPAGGPASFTLELPEPAAPETGTLAPAVSQPNGPAPTPRPPTQTLGQPIPGAVRGAVPVGGPGRPGMPLRPGMIPPGTVPPGRGMAVPGFQPIQPPQPQESQRNGDDDN